MLNYKDKAFLNNSNFSKYGTIQMPSGFNNLNTIVSNSYGTNKHLPDTSGFTNLMKNNTFGRVVNPRNFRSNLVSTKISNT